MILFANKLFKIVIVLFFVTSCQKKEEIDPNSIIISGKILEYEDLDLMDLGRVCEFCAYYTDNWNQPHQFDPKYSYYIKVKIDNKKLAKITASTSLKIHDLLTDNPYMLYGKYKNRIILTDSFDMPILETSKFQGQTIMNIHREGNFDDVLIGPIVESPKKIKLQILESKDYPEITPEYIFL